jgi:hypothetical protein
MPPEDDAAPSWKEALPQELKDAPSLKDYKDVAGLAKSHVELQKMVGNSIRPPGPDAAPEARQEFFTKLQKLVPELVNSKDEAALLSALGKPQKPEEYSPPTELKDLPEAVVNGWRAQAAELGLTKKQAEAALKKQFEAYSQMNVTIENSKSELKKDWGTALEERTRLAAVAAEKMGFPPAALDIIKSGKGSATEMKAFYNMAKALGMDKPGNEMSQQGPGSNAAAMTPLEANERIAEIQKRPEYWKPNINPTLTKHLQAEMLRLQGIANPEE